MVPPLQSRLFRNRFRIGRPIRSDLRFLVQGVFVFPFQFKQVVANILGIPAGAGNLRRIILKRPDPALDIGRMIAGIVSHADLLSKHPAGDFRA